MMCARAKTDDIDLKIKLNNERAFNCYIVIDTKIVNEHN